MATTMRRGARWLRRGVRLVAATFAFSAEGIHLAVLQEQVQVWWAYGLFFLAVAIAQGLLGASLLFDLPSRRIARLGILVNLTVVLVWVFTRIGGVPIWNLFIPLPVEGVDLAATLLELGLIAMLAILPRLRRDETVAVSAATLRPA